MQYGMRVTLADIMPLFTSCSNPAAAPFQHHHCTAVVKYSVALIYHKLSAGQGQSGQAIKLFQAPRKISFTFHFLYKSIILHDVKLAA